MAGQLGMYPCKWCHLEVRSAEGTSGLWSHRHGSKQGTKTWNPGCKQRNAAIEFGCLLPPTEFQLQNKASNHVEGQTSITAFAHTVPKFDNQILNQMLGMWVIQTAQPWRRVKDPYLRASFRPKQVSSNYQKARQRRGWAWGWLFFYCFFFSFLDFSSLLSPWIIMLNFPYHVSFTITKLFVFLVVVSVKVLLTVPWMVATVPVQVLYRNCSVI